MKIKLTNERGKKAKHFLKYIDPPSGENVALNEVMGAVGPGVFMKEFTPISEDAWECSPEVFQKWRDYLAVCSEITKILTWLFESYGPQMAEAFFMRHRPQIVKLNLKRRDEENKKFLSVLQSHFYDDRKQLKKPALLVEHFTRATNQWVKRRPGGEDVSEGWWFFTSRRRFDGDFMRDWSIAENVEFDEAAGVMFSPRVVFRIDEDEPESETPEAVAVVDIPGTDAAPGYRVVFVGPAVDYSPPAGAPPENGSEAAEIAASGNGKPETVKPPVAETDAGTA